MTDFKLECINYIYIIIKENTRKIYHFIIYNSKENKQILKFENCNYNFIYRKIYLLIENALIQKLANFLLINY